MKLKLFFLNNKYTREVFGAERSHIVIVTDAIKDGIRTYHTMFVVIL